MKKFFTEIVNAIRGVTPSTDAGVSITNQIADAVTTPFEKLADEIETTVTNKVKDATGEALVTAVTNKVNEGITASLDFSKEGSGKNAIEAAVKIAVEAAVKTYDTKITDLETEITNMKGAGHKPSNQNDSPEPVGGFTNKK